MATQWKGRARVQSMSLMLKAAKAAFCVAFGMSTYYEQSPWEIVVSSTAFMTGGRRLRGGGGAGAAGAAGDVREDVERLQQELGSVAGALEATQDELGQMSRARDKVEDTKEDVQRLEKDLSGLPKALGDLHESTKEANSDAVSAAKEMKERMERMRASLDDATQDVNEIIAPPQALAKRKYDFGLKFAVVSGAVFSVGLLVELSKKAGLGYAPLTDKQCPFQWCWYIPVTMVYLVVLVAAAIVIPIRGQPHASCSTGMLWEDHFLMFLVVMAGKILEIFIYALAPCEGIGIMKFSFKFFGSLLAIVDMYTDVCFMVIAYTCGSKFWISALVIFIVGVAIAQIVVPLVAAVYFWVFSNIGVGEFGLAKIVGFDILYELAPDSEPAEFRDTSYGPGFALMASGLRCCCEDLFQTVNQILFVRASGQNPQVLVSIAIGFLSSLLNLSMGLYNFLKPCK